MTPETTQTANELAVQTASSLFDDHIAPALIEALAPLTPEQAFVFMNATLTALVGAIEGAFGPENATIAVERQARLIDQPRYAPSSTSVN